MNKTSLAALMGMLISSVSAQAQTAASSVTLYGIADACMARSKLGSSSVNLLSGGCLYGNRLGFRGSEDLGGGLRAYFNLEQGFGLDTGLLGQGGRAFGRKAIVGLSGNWGGVEMGRDYAPAFYLVQPVDPMNLGIGTASSTIWTGSPSTTAARVDNAINLLSPNWGGVSVRVQYAPGERTAPAAARGGDVLGLNVMYRSGGTLIGVSYSRVADATATADDKATTIAARQNFGGFSLSAIVQSGAWQGSRPVAAPSSSSSIFSRDYRSYLVGGTVRVGGVGSVNASFKKYDDRTGGDFDLDQTSVAYVHSLSKRTDLYAAYSVLKNKKASSYSVSDASTAYTTVTNGASTSLLTFGIKHVF